MRSRIALAAAASLVVGLAVSVASAWACTLWSRATYVNPTGTTPSSTPTPWPGRVPSGWPAMARRPSLGRGPGLRVEHFSQAELVTDRSWRQDRFRAGLPYLCLECTQQTERVGTAYTITNSGALKLVPRFSGAVVLPGQKVRIYGLLPARPIWGGLLANSALYGVVLLAAAVAPGRVRRALRRRSGRCAACGYSHAGLGGTPCPECGSPAPAAAGA